MVPRLAAKDRVSEADGSRGALYRRYLAGLCVALLALAVVGYLVGPVVLRARDTRAEQRLAEQYLTTAGLPLYPGARLRQALTRAETTSGDKAGGSTQVSFESARDFRTLVGWYEWALPSPRWDHASQTTDGIGRNWQAENRSQGRVACVRVSAPERARARVITYTVVSCDAQLGRRP